MANHRQHRRVGYKFLRDCSRSRPVSLVIASENLEGRAVYSTGAIYLVDGQVDPATGHDAVSLLPGSGGADSI